MAVVVVCVVLNGMPKREAPEMVKAAEVRAANPCHDVMRAIFMPTVAMMRHPPKLAPMHIVSANTPMSFCLPLRPQLKVMNAADRF